MIFVINLILLQIIHSLSDTYFIKKKTYLINFYISGDGPGLIFSELFNELRCIIPFFFK